MKNVRIQRFVRLRIRFIGNNYNVILFTKKQEKTWRELHNQQFGEEWFHMYKHFDNIVQNIVFENQF